MPWQLTRVCAHSTGAAQAACAEPHPLARPCAQVCGEGDGIEGDAVVPLRSALLEGAEHVVLDGVFHRQGSGALLLPGVSQGQLRACR